ncbi:MAG TPA: hypothetical protein PLC25_04795 [Bacilli bacterium]|nr:hypothetical protein [Bacilli bacterium]
MAPGLSKYMTNDELKTEFRDLKLKVINSELKFNVNKSVANQLSKELEFVSKEFGSDILSGSIVLKLYGLLRRDINDIDILIDDKSRYSGYSIGGYDEDSVPNRLGKKTFFYKKGFFSRKKEYNVDFFENTDAPYDLVKIGDKTFKLHNPFDIINYKMSMILSSTSSVDSSRKHNEDLSSIFRHFGLLDHVNDYHNMLDNI